MTIREIYEKVCLKHPIPERIFFHRFNDTVAEIMAMFPEDIVLIDSQEWTPIMSLKGLVQIRPLFIPGIVDNILYLSGLGEQYKADFLDKTNNAGVRYKSTNTAKVIKRNTW